MVEQPPSSLSAFAHQGVRGGGVRVRGGAGARGGGGRDALGARVPAEARQVLLADRKTQVMLVQRKKKTFALIFYGKLLKETALKLSIR